MNVVKYKIGCKCKMKSVGVVKKGQRCTVAALKENEEGKKMSITAI